MFPGMDGGADWGGPAFDPETRSVVCECERDGMALQSIERATSGVNINGRELYVRESSSCHREDRTGSPPPLPFLVGIADRMSQANVRAMIFYGGGRMPSFAALPAE